MKTSELTPLIDCDVITYRCGFAVKDDEPLEYALSTVKHSVLGILDKFPDRKDQRLFLTGKNNFRDKIATIQVYKGNRDPSHKPKFYQEIKDYLIDVHGAEVVNGIEADDAQGMEQWKHKDRSTVIVGIDKDMRMIPGWHYNYVKDILDYVTLQDGNAFFFHQMLVGDRTDNVPGIKGLGEVKAAKLLAPCQKDVIRMRDTVMEQYIKQYGSDGERAYHEVANLLWIRREPDQQCPF